MFRAYVFRRQVQLAVCDAERAGLPTTPRHCWSPPGVATVLQPDDVDDDVTTTTSGSYVVDMTTENADWRRQIVTDVYQGVLV